VMLSAMVLIILLGSINYDNALGYLLAFLLFGLFLVGVLHTYRNLTSLSLLGVATKPVFAGGHAEFNLAIDNRSHWRRYSIELSHWPSLQHRLWRRRRLATSVSIATLPPSEIGHATIVIDAPQRGWLKLQKVRIASVFPLGILRAWGYFEPTEACLIYPKPIGHLPFPRYSTSADATGLGKFPGDEDFAGLRPYQLGDPIRAIAWKSYARQDVLVVKRFTSGGVSRVDLRWNDCRRLADFELSISQLSQWVLEADRRRMHYGLQLPGLDIKPDLGPAHRHLCLRALALYSTP